MFPMRLKIGPARNNEWRCCLCLHVRTATILLGSWHLILHIVALCALSLLMRNHHILMQREEGNILPTPLSKIKKDEDGPRPYYLPQDGRPIYGNEMDMSALMTVCTLAITLLLVYGAVKGRATHILPFFCLQLFDFAITALTATGFFFYLRSGHQFISENYKHMPFQSELLHLNPQQLSSMVLVIFLLALFWKGYCIRIVWRCYKFLTLRQSAMRSTVHYILPGEGTERIPEPDYSTLLPDYEAACASAMKQAPPPSYQAAMENQPPTYPEATTNTHVVNVNPVEDSRYSIRLVFSRPVTDSTDGVDAVSDSENNETQPAAMEERPILLDEVVSVAKEEGAAVATAEITLPKETTEEGLPSTSQSTPDLK